MTVRVAVNPELLTWARERSGLDFEALAERFPRLAQWEQGESLPTLRQLEKFARKTNTPVGYLFLEQPPEELLPMPDYRTLGDQAVERPSPDLLDSISQCIQRQDWYREFARANGQENLRFVGAFSTATPVLDAAAWMRQALAFDVNQRGATRDETLRLLIDHAENLGVLVMVNGVVGNNTHRKLNPEEFRGFALVDALAPVVFVNGADTKAGQIFTLAHELAHLWLGESALSDALPTSRPNTAFERWCNDVAAELLVPLARLNDEFDPQAPLTDELERLANRYKVSTLVILRRVFDGGHLEWGPYRAAYEAEVARVREILAERGGAGGGNFYNTQPLRVSRRFAHAIIGSTLEGRTLYRDAFQMLGFRKVATFHELAARLQAE